MKEDTSKKQAAVKAIQTERKEQKETYAFYIGIDMGDKNSDVCVLDHEGEFRKEFRAPMKASNLQTHFTSITSIPRSPMAIKAGGQSRWVAEVVEGCGHRDESWETGAPANTRGERFRPADGKGVQRANTNGVRRLHSGFAVFDKPYAMSTGGEGPSVVEHARAARQISQDPDHERAHGGKTIRRIAQGAGNPPQTPLNMIAGNGGRSFSGDGGLPLARLYSVPTGWRWIPLVTSSSPTG